MKKNNKIRWQVLIPPWIVVISVLILNLLDYDSFLLVMNSTIGWILKNFAWMFNSITLVTVILVVIAYVSPIGNVRFGGSQARPIVSYRNYIWIVLCTIMGAGLMLWACAEPILHIHNPPANVTAGALSGDAVLWAMETIFLEWSFTPMALYALPTVLFAFVFYNMHKDFSIGSMLYPLLKKRVTVRWNNLIDTVCLFCLCLGMASTLGSGILLIVEGVSRITNGTIQMNVGSWSICGAIIIVGFILSAASGLRRGIKHLSTINSWFYLVLGFFVFLAGPTSYILNLCAESFGGFLSDFFKLSLWTSTSWGDGWSLWWPQFYWCIGLSWMPVSAVFLGKISKGYTVRETLKAIFVIPSLFSIIWTALFSGSSIWMEFQGAGIYDAIEASGVAAAAYNVLEQLPMGAIILPLFLLTAFISYITAADSNVHAMASLCTNELNEDGAESPIFLKAFWGLTIGGICLIMLTSFNIDGMKMLANIGGFFASFLMILFIFSFVRIMKHPHKYDCHIEDYDETGKPRISRRLSQEDDKL